MMMKLKELIQAWTMSSKHHTFHPPATELDLKLVEAKLGIRLPSPLRKLYLFSNGMYLLNGNLQIYPLEETDKSMGLSNASTKLREWHWQIPREVLAFGNNGSDEQLGIWLPKIRSDIFKHPILEIGEIFSTPQSMGVLATGLVPFLFGWTACYLMLYDADSIALDALDLPRSLRYKSDEMDDDIFTRLRLWADPRLPDPNPDPYKYGYDAEGLKQLFGV